MKSQILLALLPFVPVALANASDSWNSVCGKTPKADTTIDGQKFQYICHERHSGTVSKEIGDFNHPDDCARLIVSRPEEQIVWMVKNGNGQCRILQQGGNTKPWTKNDILVMKKTEDTDEDLDADEDPAVELQKCKAELQKCRAGSCGSDSSSGSSSGSSSDSSSTATPECGERFRRNGEDWKITCDKFGSSVTMRPTETTDDLEGCIDKCNARRGDGCKRVTLTNTYSNNCLMMSDDVENWDYVQRFTTAERV